MSAEFGNLNLKSSEGMYRGVRVFYFHKNVHTSVQYGPLHILRGPHKKVELSTPLETIRIRFKPISMNHNTYPHIFHQKWYKT